MPNINHNDLDGGTVVADRGAGNGARIGIVAIGFLLLVGLIYVNWPRERARSLVDSQDEFSTGRYAIREPGEKPPMPTPADMLPPQQPAQVQQKIEEGTDLDAERRRREEELRQKQLEALWKRLRSDQMVIDAGQTGETGADRLEMMDDGQIIPVTGADSNSNSAFLDQAARQRGGAVEAERNLRTDALIAEGTVIRGFLETAINTDLPGLVRAVVREDVYSFDGRRVLIPKGTRLVGEYKSNLERGQVRVFIVWNRLIRSDGVSVRIASPGADHLGRAGMTGAVDRHLAERFSAALMISMLSAGFDVLQAGASDSEVNISINSSQGSNTSLAGIALEEFKQSSKIPPTVHVDQGSPVVILVRSDLDFSALYADPVQQEVMRLRRGGRPYRAIDPTPLYMTPKDNWYPPVPAK